MTKATIATTNANAKDRLTPDDGLGGPARLRKRNRRRATSIATIADFLLGTAPITAPGGFQISAAALPELVQSTIQEHNCDSRRFFLNNTGHDYAAAVCKQPGWFAMPASAIRSKGQTTIPAEIRRHLKLKAGDRVEFVVEADGKVVLVPATVDVRELKGLLASAPRCMSVAEMEAAVRKRAGR